ncbi:MAG: TolC family protein [Fimbriiglobus sp.]
MPNLKQGRKVACGLVAGLISLAGCSRADFRKRADRDVEGVITQKNTNDAWKVENWHVYPDSRARFADPSCPDFPPFPPDDPAALMTSPNPQKPGRGGAGRYEGDGYLQQLRDWDAQNRAEDASTETLKPLPTPATDASAAVLGAALSYKNVFESQEPAFRIRLEQAVELAIFNSREFQDRREDLYLSALPVTLERFSFAAQAFAAEQVIRESVGRDVPGGGGEAWRINSEAGISRRFATGGELLIRLANQIAIDLSGDKPQTSISNLGLTFIQPLLRGGGLAATLENLTQAERTLLYSIRSYARFRKVFYVAMAGRGDYTNNPYGLQGLAANFGRGVGANLTARPTGYMPTVLLGATLANEKQNVTRLESLLGLFENLKELPGGVTELQVQSVEQNLIDSRTTVLNSTRLYIDNLDFYKLQLGVPATVALELDDAPLRPMKQQLGKFEEVYEQLREVEQQGGQFQAGEKPADLRNRWMKLLTESSLARGTAFAKNYPKQAEDLRRELDGSLDRQYKALAEAKQKLLDARAAKQKDKLPIPPEWAIELEGIDSAMDRIRFEQTLRMYEMQNWRRLPAEKQAGDQAGQFRAVFEAGALLAIQPRNQRLQQIRKNWPELPPINLDGVDVLSVPIDEAYLKVAQSALTNRLDLMNARAQVVDQYRKIAVAANSLEGTFDVRYDLNTTTPRDQASVMGFSGMRTSHVVTLRAEPPFVRRAERNQYRAALISYQRQRRNLQAFEDNIITDARGDLRSLRAFAETYKLQQRAVELAYAQVDNAASTLVAPPDPSAREGAGSIAALTQQLLNAQRSLLGAQNDLYTTWINYQTTRMELYLDLELLPLDSRGLWTDELSSTRPEQSTRPAASGGGNGGPLPGPLGREQPTGPQPTP